MSKTKKLVSREQFHGNRRNLNRTKVTVIHHNPQIKGRRKKQQHHALRHEYNAWLQALSQDYEYNQHSSPLSARKRKKDPRRTTIRNKVRRKMQNKYSSTGVEICFFNNLLVGQVISNAYLPEKISTCPIKIGAISFEAVYLRKKL